MIFIILAWVFWFLFCFNLGFFVLHHLLDAEHRQVGFFYNFWFGLFVFILVLEFISVFYPLNEIVLICLAGVNILLFAINLRRPKIKLNLTIEKLLNHVDLKKVILFIPIALVVSLIANLPVSWYDSLLYHLSSVKWIADYGTVKGLANFYFPLGYSNATFILAAIMDNGIYTNSSSHVMNSFLFFTFFCQIVLYLFNKKKNNLAYIFGLFSLLILSTFTYQINSLSTDLSLAVFMLLSSFYIVAFDKKRMVLALPILILAAISKFSSFAVLGIFLVYVAFELNGKIFLKKNFYVLLLCSLFIFGFVLRNIIMSGWPFYPLQVFGFSLPWQVPPEQIKIINDGLTAWARLPGPNYMNSITVGFRGWFIPWFTNNKSNYLMYYLYAIIPLLFVYLLFRNRLKKLLGIIDDISKIDILIFANLVTLIYTFITAPDLRYMGTYVLIEVSLISSVLFCSLIKVKPVNILVVLIFIYLLFSNLTEPLNFSGKKIRIQKEESTLVKSVEMVYPDQSFNVLVPINDDRCGNSELPCAPHAYGFKMFQPGNLKGGYLSSLRN